MRLKLTVAFFLSLLVTLSALGAPAWIKRGFVAVYSTRLLSGVEGRGGTTSGTAGFGDAVFVVEGVYRGIPYGHLFLVANSSGGVFFQEKAAAFKLPELSFYLNPGEVDRWLKERPPENCKVHGVKGDVTVECVNRGEKSVLRIKYDRKGLITYALTGAWSSGRGWQSLQAEYALKSTGKLELPEAPMPPEALKPHSYSVFLFTPIGNSPLGTLEVTPVGKEGGLTTFRISSPEGTRVEAGTDLMGPHYVNPELLKREHIISVPEAGFEIRKLGETPQGVAVGVFYGGQPVEERVYDGRTGLLIRAKVPSVGGYAVITLTR